MKLNKVVNKLKISFFFILILIAISNCNDSKNTVVKAVPFTQKEEKMIDSFYKAIFRDGKSLYMYSIEHPNDFHRKFTAEIKKERNIIKTLDRSTLGKYLELVSKMFFCDEETLKKFLEPSEKNSNLLSKVSEASIPIPVPLLQKYKKEFKNNYEIINEDLKKLSLEKNNEDLSELIRVFDGIYF